MTEGVASPRMATLAQAVAARPWTTVVLALLLTALALVPLSGIDTTTSMEDYQPATAERDAGRTAYREFPLPSHISTVATAPDGSSDGNVLTRASLAELAALEAHLRADPTVQAWLYNTSRPVVSPGSLVIGSLAAQGFALDAATANASGLPVAPKPVLQAVLGQLIGDPRSAGVFGAPRLTEGVWVAPSAMVTVVVDKRGAYNDEEADLAVRAAVHAFASPQSAGERLELNTMAAPNVAMQEASESTLATLLPITFVMMGLLLYWTLRRLSDVVLALAADLMALLWMFAAGEVLGLGFSQYTFIAPILVLALGVDDAIHILHRYRADYGRGMERALMVSIGTVGTALLLTTLTTMAAFGANRASAVPAIRDFGLLVACGIGADFIVTTTFLPAARLLLDRWRRPELAPLEETSRIAPLLERLVHTVCHQRTAVLTVALLLTAGSLWAATQLEQELEMVELVEPESEIYLGFTVFERDFGTTSGEAAGLLVEGEALARPAVLRALTAAQANMGDDGKIAQLNGTPRTESIADYVRAVVRAAVLPLNLTDDDGDGVPDSAFGCRAAIGWLLVHGLGNATSTEMRALVHPDGNGDYDAFLINVVSADIGTLGGEQLLEELEADAAPLRTAGLATTAYGQPIERYQMLSTMTDGMLRSVFVSIALCLLLLIGLRRSVREGLEAIAPVLLVTAWVYGTIWALGWALNVVTVSIAAITIGVGVDFAVHLLHRYREMRLDGHEPEPAMAEAVRHTGTPLLGAGLTTIAGFGVLWFSSMAIFSQFGLLTALMILYALVASLVVLPVLVLTLTRAHPPHSHSPRAPRPVPVGGYRASPPPIGAPDNLWAEGGGVPGGEYDVDDAADDDDDNDDTGGCGTKGGGTDAAPAGDAEPSGDPPAAD